MTRPVPITNRLHLTMSPYNDVGGSRPDAFSILSLGFLSCLLFIVGVSIYDSYLVAINRECILYDERNPICAMLIQKDPSNLSWFMTGKFLGNLGVVGTLLLLRWARYRYTLVVAQSVAMFQLALLMFLTFSDSKTGLLHFDGLFSHDPDTAAKALNSVMLHAVVMVAIIGAAAFAVIRWKTIRNPPGSEPATV